MVCTGSTGKGEPPPALPCLGTIRLSPAWKFVLNVYKGSKKGYKKVKAILISPPGEVGRSNAPPASPPPTPLSQLPEILDTVEAQSSGIHIHTAQLRVLEEPIQRENFTGGNSSWR